MRQQRLLVDYVTLGQKSVSGLGAATYALTGPLVVGSILYLRKKTLADNMRSGPAATALPYLALTVMLLIGVGGIWSM